VNSWPFIWRLLNEVLLLNCLAIMSQRGAIFIDWMKYELVSFFFLQWCTQGYDQNLTVMWLCEIRACFNTLSGWSDYLVCWC
jgi:hypothetical protein